MSGAATTYASLSLVQERPEDTLQAAQGLLPGETITFEVVGELEVREMVNPTTFTVEATLENGQLRGTAAAQLRMSDFGFDPPAIGNLLEAENDVDVAFDFVAVPAQ